MQKKLLTQIRNEWRSNLWLALELLVVSVVMWYITDLLYCRVATYLEPRGFDTSHCYLLTMRQLNLPWYMNGIILAALLTLIICVAFNLRWKLSEHMAGAGGIVGGLVAFSELFGYNPVGWLCIFILVAGMLGSARIILRHHTQGEVLGGFAVGLLCSLAALHPGSKLLIYLFSYILF